MSQFVFFIFFNTVCNIFPSPSNLKLCMLLMEKKTTPEKYLDITHITGELTLFGSF